MLSPNTDRTAKRAPAVPPVADRTAALIAEGRHRQIVGGQWDRMGELQLAFLRDAGLLPSHRLLDIGCGCLRAGVKLIPYLEPNNYYGIDAEKALLEAGFRKEVGKAGLRDRIERKNLYTSQLFHHRRLEDGTVDMAICHSVVVHLPLNHVRICLENTQRYFKPGGRLFMSFFPLPRGAPFGERHTNPAGAITSGAAEPFHHRVADMVHAAEDTGWTARHVGPWGHPRGQEMMEYVRR